MAAIGIGIVVWRASRPFDGAHFGLFVALYAAARLLLETFQGDSATLAGLRVVQLWSLLSLVIGLVLLRRWAGERTRHTATVSEMT